MKQNRSLDFLRDAAGLLLLKGAPAGCLVSYVEPMWGLGRPFRLQERVWLTIEWADGQRDEDIEDYEPWILRDALAQRWLDWDEEPHAGRYTVDWLSGDERTTLLQRLRPQQG